MLRTLDLMVQRIPLNFPYKPGLFNVRTKRTVLPRTVKHITSLERCCSGFSRSEQWQFLTDVSGQPVGPIFDPEDWTDRSSRNVEGEGNYLYSPRNDPEEHKFHPFRDRILKSNTQPAEWTNVTLLQQYRLNSPFNIWHVKLLKTKGICVI